MANDIGATSTWKLLQVGLVVKDMDRATERLSALGFGPFVPKYLPPESKETFRGKPADVQLDVQRSTVGNIELELLQPISGESPHQEFLETRGEGIQHILFEVQDIDAELKRLTGQGAAILLHVNFKGGQLVYVDLNTCGFIIELIQLPKDDPETLKVLLSR